MGVEGAFFCSCGVCCTHCQAAHKDKSKRGRAGYYNTTVDALGIIARRRRRRVIVVKNEREVQSLALFWPRPSVASMNRNTQYICAQLGMLLYTLSVCCCGDRRLNNGPFFLVIIQALQTCVLHGKVTCEAIAL